MFYPPAEFLSTTRITRVEGEPFKTEGKVMVKAGWMEVYGKEVASEERRRASCRSHRANECKTVRSRL